MSSNRIWYPFTFEGRDRRVYRVSFRIAEEATWDHRFHDLDGRELTAAELGLPESDLHRVQASCDAAVGSLHDRALSPNRRAQDHCLPVTEAASAA